MSLGQECLASDKMMARLAVMCNANAVLFLPLNLVTPRNNNECNKNISMVFGVVVFLFVLNNI